MLTWSSLPNTERIDVLNIGLILLAWGLALLFPFPLFLFAYAVLGPLHYLTEISWLHDRSYFIREKQGVRVFVLMSIIVTAGIFSGWIFPVLVPTLVYSLFGGAFILSSLKEQRAREIALAVLFVTAVLFTVFQPPLYVLLFTLFIPTAVHVFVFTGTFMLSGALKSESLPGLMACLLLLLAAVSLFFIVPDRGGLLPSQYVLDSYQPFAGVNVAVMNLFKASTGNFPTLQEVFTSHIGQAVMQFLAFAYTYHYLNWFSKVRIIGWNGMPSLRRKVIGVGWITALAVYAYDYRIGVQVLFFLSFLHVLLEFPLNHRSFVDIATRLVPIQRA
jgi:hypothetical protein